LSFDLRESVRSIEGIGSSISAALSRIQVDAVLDLLHVDSDEIYDAVKSMTSHAAVRSWRSMASLLQVDEITPQWAEALVKGGVQSPEELMRRDLDDVAAIFRAAYESRIIPAAPSNAQIVRMMVDAAILQHTCSISGRVTDRKRSPLQEVRARIGWRSQVTDRNGIFHITRIPSDTGAPLIVERSGYAAVTVTRPFLVRDPSTIRMARFELPPEPAQTPRRGAALSEFDGDMLPEIRGVRIRAERMDGDLRGGDILVVNNFLERSPEVDLVSRFRSYVDGDIVVWVFRLPAAALPEGAKLRDEFKVDNGRLVPAQTDSVALYREKVARILRKQFAASPNPAGEAEFKALLENMVAFASSRGLLFVPTGGRHG
jgi:hypothetical protein